MALNNTQNLTWAQAIKRGAIMWNARITKWGNYSAGIAGGADLNLYKMGPPAYSILGVAINPESTARQALIQWTPAGLPSSSLTGGLAPWTATGSKILVTKDAPLLMPLQGQISVLPFLEDLYRDAYTDLAGVVQPFGDAIGSKSTNQPLLSLDFFLRPPGAVPTGPRRDWTSLWTAASIAAAADDEEIVEIIPAASRKSVRFSFKSDPIMASSSLIRITGLVGFEGPVGVLGAGLREVLLPQFAGSQLPAFNGALTMEGSINCQWLVIRARSLGAAGSMDYQWELRDGAGCCEASIGTSNGCILPVEGDSDTDVSEGGV